MQSPLEHELDNASWTCSHAFGTQRCGRQLHHTPLSASVTHLCGKQVKHIPLGMMTPNKWIIPGEHTFLEPRYTAL